jgi:hypothetical protein
MNRDCSDLMFIANSLIVFGAISGSDRDGILGLNSRGGSGKPPLLSAMVPWVLFALAVDIIPFGLEGGYSDIAWRIAWSNGDGLHGSAFRRQDRGGVNL